MRPYWRRGSKLACTIAVGTRSGTGIADAAPSRSEPLRMSSDDTLAPGVVGLEVLAGPICQAASVGCQVWEDVCCQQ